MIVCSQWPCSYRSCISARRALTSAGQVLDPQQHVLDLPVGEFASERWHVRNVAIRCVGRHHAVLVMATRLRHQVVQVMTVPIVWRAGSFRQRGA